MFFVIVMSGNQSCFFKIIVICQVINHVFCFFNCYMSGNQSCFFYCYMSGNQSCSVFIVICQVINHVFF